MTRYSPLFRKDNSIKHTKWKLICILFCLSLALILTIKLPYYSYANTEDTESSITSSVHDILDKMDLTQLQSVVDDLDDVNIFTTSVKDKISSIISGQYFTNYSSLFTGVISIIFGDVRNYLPMLFTLIAIGLLSSVLVSLNSTQATTGTQDIIKFICFSTVVMIVLAAFKKMLILTGSILASISKQMQIIFPILITLLTSIGSLSSVSIYKPLVSILTLIANLVFDKFLYPIFILIMLMTVIGNLTNTVKLDKLTGFFTSLFKWSIGIVFTLFSGFLSLQGITAGKYDNISIKATKFAVKSYIPLIGGYISDGMDFIILGSVLVKNTLGLIGVLVLFVTILSPIINMLIFKFTLQLSAGILEVSGESKISSFLNSCSKLIVYPIVILLSVSFMYIITIALIMCTANIF